jgi:hypothetical protein
MSEVKSFKLVPASMLLDKETIGVINFHCGDGEDGQFGEYSDGHLWVGTVTDDDGKEVYGLHLSTAEYPEEGSSTLIEFDQPEDAAQAELAALREELANRVDRVAELAQERNDLRKALTAAEQRNELLEDLIRRSKEWIAAADCNVLTVAIDVFSGAIGDSAERLQVYSPQLLSDMREALGIKPTESGASE